MNLNFATPEQLETYKLSVCKVLGIDPLFLDYIDIPNAQGYGTDKVLYAKRGAAEILRNNLGISVTSLVQTIQDGWVMFTAVGVDKKGRQEISVGAAYINDSKGDKLAHAIMTAQTRAVRRLTLQFVTGGVLDESEVQTQAQFTGAPAASGAALAGSPMVVPPPLAPVKPPVDWKSLDLTPSIVFDNKVVNDLKTSYPTMSELALTLPTPEPPQAVVEVAPKDAPFVISTVESPVTPHQEAAKEADILPVAAPKVRKPRAKKDKSFGDPAQMVIPAGVIDAEGIVKPDLAEELQKQAAWKANQDKLRAEAMDFLNAKPSTPVVPSPSAQTVATPVVGTEPPKPVQTEVAPLTSEQKDIFKDKTKNLRDTLEKSGLMPLTGIGGSSMILRAFGEKFSGVGKSTPLSADQNQKLFDFTEAFIAKFGAHALVQYINQQLEVKS